MRTIKCRRCVTVAVCLSNICDLCMLYSNIRAKYANKNISICFDLTQFLLNLSTNWLQFDSNLTLFDSVLTQFWLNITRFDSELTKRFDSKWVISSQNWVKPESNRIKLESNWSQFVERLSKNWVESKQIEIFLFAYFTRMFEYSMHKSHLLERHTATITHLLHFIGRVLNFFFMTYYPDDVCTCRNSFDISCPNHKALTSHSTAI